MDKVFSIFGVLDFNKSANYRLYSLVEEKQEQAMEGATVSVILNSECQIIFTISFIKEILQIH